MVVVGQVAAVGRAVVGLKGKAQVVVRHPAKAKRRLERRRVVEMAQDTLEKAKRRLERRRVVATGQWNQ